MHPHAHAKSPSDVDGLETGDAGLGISVIPTLAIPPEGLPQLAVRPLLPRINREIMLVHRRNRALSPVAQAAWDLVRDVAAQRAST